MGDRVSGYLKQNARSLVFLAFLVVMLFAGLQNVKQKPAAIRHPETYGYKWAFWEVHFREAFETVIFVFRDGTAYAFTSSIDFGVLIPPAVIIGYFKRDGKEVSDLIIVIHNHIYPGGFSDKDKQFCRYLRSLGFKGHFLLYGPRGTVIEYGG